MQIPNGFKVTNLQFGAMANFRAGANFIKLFSSFLMNGQNALRKPSYPSLMFVSRAESCLRRAPLRRTRLRQAPGLTHKYNKYNIRLKRLARGKRAGLFGPFFTREEKRFY